MWYFKKTAQSVWNASKNLIDKRTPIQKLIDTLADNQQQILPTNKLSQLSTLTYQVDTFDQIVTIIFDKLKKFHYDLQQSQKSLNILVTTNYLIKHGATGFVDQFRKYIYMFKKYQQLEIKPTYQDNITQAQLDSNIQKIKSRAHHISQLLSNKQKLLKQKQLSMLVKQKLKLYQKNKMNQLKKQNYSNNNQRELNKNNKSNQSQSQSQTQYQNKKKQVQDFSVKLQGLLQSYVWKYVDKLDETIESASQKVMQQIDKYVLGQNTEHHKFQMQEDDDNKNFNQDNDKQQQQNSSNKKIKKDNKQKQQKKSKTNIKKQNNYDNNDDEDLMKKLQQQTKNTHIENSNLLQFEQVKPKIIQKQPIQDLI